MPIWLTLGPNLASLRAMLSYRFGIQSDPLWSQTYHPWPLITFVCTDVIFGHKVGQIGPKWDKTGDFSDQIHYILAGPKVGQIGPKWDKTGIFLDLSKPKYTEICSEKDPDLSHLGPIWPSLSSNLVILIHHSVHPAQGSYKLRAVWRQYLPYPTNCHNVDCET